MDRGGFSPFFFFFFFNMWEVSVLQLNKVVVFWTKASAAGTYYKNTFECIIKC
jgi:hypothetical protein